MNRRPSAARMVTATRTKAGSSWVVKTGQVTVPRLFPRPMSARSLNLGVERCGEFLSHPDGRGRVTFPPFSPGPHRPLIHLQIMCELPIRHAAHLPHGVQ